MEFQPNNTKYNYGLARFRVELGLDWRRASEKSHITAVLDFE